LASLVIFAEKAVAALVISRRGFKRCRWK